MTERLFFTESDEANALLAADPMALLIGFALDQQVSVQKAFSGPLVIRQRVGSLDAAVLAKRFGVAAAEGLVPGHPTLGDVDSLEAPADYQAGKRAHKAQLRAARGA